MSGELEYTNRPLEERYAQRWLGKYRAFVRDNNDPERLGRVRMEVPAVLGTGRENWSEWAYPCFPYGGNQDCGMFLVPEAGASVWAEFEGGHAQHPIWSGVWLAGSNPGEQPGESQRLCAAPACLDCEDKLERAAHRPDDLEHKKYHGHPPYSCPRMKVLMKTETGHTILADDRDGTECLRIIDRAGQMLELQGAVKPALQAGNALPRGKGCALEGTQLDLASQIVGRRGQAALADLAGQRVVLEAWQDREKIHILSRNRAGTRWQKILIDTTARREKIRLTGLNGLQEVVIDSTLGLEKIQLRDRAGQFVVMNAVPGAEHIRATDRAGSVVMMDAVGGNVLVRSASKVMINP